MSEESPSQIALSSVAERRRRQGLGRLWRLMLKELRETLRDRRTIITLVVMPTLIYPLLALAFQRFLLTSVSGTRDVQYDIGVAPESMEQILSKLLTEGHSELAATHRDRNDRERRTHVDASKSNPKSASHASDDVGAPQTEPKVALYPMPPEELARAVGSSMLHLGVLARSDPDDDPDRGVEMPHMWELIYRRGSPASEAALHFVEERLSAVNAKKLDERLKQLGVTATLDAPTERRAIEFAGAPIFSLAALIPLVLVLMTVTGAVYPAIDLTAGERERGTLEMLIAAPVPRLGLLLAKYAAVLTVALLTALVNLTAMTVTIQSTGLETTLFGASGMSLGVVVKVLLLLALFAAFFSAVLLALTSYARSFKEAQAYIIPLMLLCLVPGVLCLLPSLEFRGWMSVTPLVNMLMLARDLLEGHVNKMLAAAAVFSTIFYIAAAIALAARIFGTDAILYGSQATWSDFFHRPSGSQSVASLPAAMLCLAMMFPICFLLTNSLVHSQDISASFRLIAISLITLFVFGGIPMIIATFGRVRFASGFGLGGAKPSAFLAAALLGLALWPLAYEVYLTSAKMGLSALGSEQIERAQKMITQLRGLPFGLIFVTFALVPGVIEELCFRGFLFASLRAVLTAAQTIVVTAIVFGLFHEVLLAGRVLPSLFLGLVLGWVRLRTGSVLPCMVLHVLHNGILFAIIHWRDALAARSWGFSEQTHLPGTWLVSAGAVIIVAGVMLAMSTRRRPIAS